MVRSRDQPRNTPHARHHHTSRSAAEQSQVFYTTAASHRSTTTRAGTSRVSRTRKQTKSVQVACNQRVGKHQFRDHFGPKTEVLGFKSSVSRRIQGHDRAQQGDPDPRNERSHDLEGSGGEPPTGKATAAMTKFIHRNEPRVSDQPWLASDATQHSPDNTHLWRTINTQPPRGIGCNTPPGKTLVTQNRFQGFIIAPKWVIVENGAFPHHPYP